MTTYICCHLYLKNNGIIIENIKNIYIAYGYKSSSPFLCGSFMMGLALIFHIRDITGKPIDVIFNKLNKPVEIHKKKKIIVKIIFIKITS